MKSLAVIPVHGRLPLLKITIRRLFEKNGVDHVICIGSTEEEKRVCNALGAEFHFHENKPLGKKWNYGFKKAEIYHPDCVVYVGSSDWLSDNWIPVLYPFVVKYEIVGKRDFNMLHIGKELKLAHWYGYPLGSGRKNEPIGGGRLISGAWLDRIGWKPFDDELNRSMDYSMMCKLVPGRDRVLIYNMPEIWLLAVSCDMWQNMHTGDFIDAKAFRVPEMWLGGWFPEYKELWNIIR